MTCAACGRETGAEARFCPGCGAVLEPSAVSPTRTLQRGGVVAGDDARSSAPSSDSLDHGRFVPGTLLLERYRILGLLGRGGMGEVYRADDLKLAQPVALKFLPEDLARDPGRLARFHNEVRLARQVSHPNVCRVYDIGEVEGSPFLSMEYIDGEDLASLLRRIGRLPGDKAVEIARQLCAGLAAAHDRGVVHRDLKPANVMIDGRGRARIADFGLAGAAAGGAADSRAGTPAYMAPEQLASGETSPRSDIYALGLVLYELFTGKRAFQGESLREIAKSRETSEPPSPSSIVEGFDDAVERVILRCLERDPRLRPASALAVAAALPGGDPLAMALAAGETPSPEMVAAAGEKGGLRPALAWALLGIIAIAVVAVAWSAERTLLLRLASPSKPCAVLIDRAQEIARLAGYDAPPGGIGFGFGWHRSYLDSIRERDQSAGRWERLSRPQPSALYFWYRQGPRPLDPDNADGVVITDDPAPIEPGMLDMQLTVGGDLWRFSAVPPQIDEGEPAPPFDWKPMFEAAGLRQERLRPVEPRWVPVAFADTRVAWEGAYESEPDTTVRIEAASHRGRPVTFQIYWPWNRPLRAQPFEPTPGERAAGTLVIMLISFALVAGLVLARRNLHLGRVDRRGAFRLAASVLAAGLLARLGRAGHLADVEAEWGLLVRLCGTSLFDGFSVYLTYVALEPIVRRRWPDRIISWTRLLGGRFNDPLVGRDVLIGVAFGAAVGLAGRLANQLPGWAGRPPAAPVLTRLELLMGLRDWIPTLLTIFSDVVSMALILLFFLLFLRVLLRRPLAATLGFSGIVLVLLSLEYWQDSGPLALLPAVAIASLFTLALTRFGVLTLAAAVLVWQLLSIFPVSMDLTSPQGLPGLFALVILLALAGLSLRVALAGQSLFNLRMPD